MRFNVVVTVVIACGCSPAVPCAVSEVRSEQRGPLQRDPPRDPLAERGGDPLAAATSSNRTPPVEALVVTVRPQRIARPLTVHAVDVSAWQFERRAIATTASQRHVFRDELQRRREWGVLSGALHSKVHPIFSDEYLTSWENEPASSADVKPADASVELWLRLSRDGEASQVAITEASEVPELNVATVASLLAALPVEVPPEMLDSIDRVGIRWRFVRDLRIACTTYNAQLFDADELTPALQASGEGP